ncbi:trigger factor [Puniceicoccales bacterium CK1056]|uniref:Trigger factor n=1 Tax=Oceanipulchritudo coccoides TaxID=2706888 RepID=A0A6B2M1W1_9BACT|nr:trigger factor [Oceanipulchritudo coccoides]
MNVSITDITETRKDVVVTISSDEISKQESSILKNFMKQAKVPGFRPGKAPEARVRQLFGSQIKEQLKESVMRSAYDEVVGQDNLDVYTIVEFPEPGDILSGQEVSIDLTVDVNPEFELPDYKGISTEVPSTEVDDKEIEDSIDRIRRQRADFEVVEREAAAGDYVKLSYTGTIDGEAIAEKLKDVPRLQAWGSVTDGWEEAGTDEAKQFGVPAVIDALVGMKAGDKKSVEQEIGDDFAVEELRGKTVTYEVETQEVRERKLPEIDEEFLKSVRAESLEDFKAQILDELENQKKRNAEDAQRDQILNFLGDAVDFPLPASAVESETQSAMARIISQNMQQGVPEEEFEKHKEQIHAGAAKSAQRDVKLQIILNRIAGKEEITVENDDLSRAVYSMAMQQRQKPEDLAKEFRKDRSRLVQLQRQILFSKTLDFLRGEAKSKTVEAAPVDEKAES